MDSTVIDSYTVVMSLTTTPELKKEKCKALRNFGTRLIERMHAEQREFDLVKYNLHKDHVHLEQTLDTLYEKLNRSIDRGDGETRIRLRQLVDTTEAALVKIYEQEYEHEVSERVLQRDRDFVHRVVEDILMEIRIIKNGK